MSYMPCPFCGGSKTRVSERVSIPVDLDKFAICCESCGVSVKGASPEDAARRWNTREGKTVSGREIRVAHGKEDAAPFYMIFVEGSQGPTKKHDWSSAQSESERLARQTERPVYVLRPVERVELAQVPINRTSLLT